MHVRLRALMLVAATAATIAAPRMAFAAATIEGFYGLARPPSADFSSSLSNVGKEPNLFNDSMQNAGGDLMFNLSWLQFGAIGDYTWASDRVSTTALGGLLGLKLGLGSLRIDLMGEVGAHRYGNLQSTVNSGKDQWLAYVGLRPGIAFKFGEPNAPGFLLGVWGFSRWDLNAGSVPVTAGNVGSVNVGNVKLGGNSIGATLRLGYAF